MLHTHLARGLLVALLALGLSACGASASNSKRGDGLSPKSEKVNMDPMLITADGKGGGQTIDVAEAFQLGLQAQKARRYEQAVPHYEAVARYFKDTKYFLPALYNAGLCYEKLEQWDKAATQYAMIIKERPRDKDTKDAYFRLAAVYEKAKRHEKTVPLMTEVLLRNDTTHFDRVEAYVRRGNGQIGMGNYVEAEDSYRNVLEINRRQTSKTRLPKNSHYISQALFGMARAMHLQTTAIKLQLPTERMSKDLDRKAKLFLRAQSAYLRALRQHHPTWSIAAGYMIGKLYEEFYVDIFTAEIPDDLTDEHIALYFEQLRKHIRPLMVRAIEVYEKNMFFVRKLDAGDNNKWADATDKQLKRLKLYLNDPFTQRKAERIVLRKQNWRKLWEPSFLISDTVSEAVEQASIAARKKHKAGKKKVARSTSKKEPDKAEASEKAKPGS